MIMAWKFLRADRRLGYGDGRMVEVGVPLEIDGPPVLCARGMHACRRAIQALKYAESAIVARVECGGEIVEGDDKLTCTQLIPVAIFDATDALRHFARLCALDVIEKWDAPEIVRRYLETGDESIREAARDAGWAAAWDTARYAAQAAARAAGWAAARDAARDAAWDTVRYAARGAGWAAARAAAWAARAAAWAAARDAARDAAWDAAGDAQNDRLEKILCEVADAWQAKEKAAETVGRTSGGANKQQTRKG